VLFFFWLVVSILPFARWRDWLRYWTQREIPAKTHYPLCWPSSILMGNLTLLVWIIQEEMMSNPSLPIGFFKGQSQHLISSEHLDFISYIYLESLDCNILFFDFHAIEYKPNHMNDFQYCGFNSWFYNGHCPRDLFISQSKVILQIVKPD
jgi:hypothetical protein